MYFYPKFLDYTVLLVSRKAGSCHEDQVARHQPQLHVSSTIGRRRSWWHKRHGRKKVKWKYDSKDISGDKVFDATESAVLSISSMRDTAHAEVLRHCTSKVVLI